MIKYNFHAQCQWHAAVCARSLGGCVSSILYVLAENMRQNEDFR